MSIPTSEAELAALFRRLGARDPEGWARSQVRAGIPQLHRYLFLRQAWRRVISADDSQWIDAEIAGASRKPDQPFAGTGHALRRLLDSGAAREDLVELVRGMQAQLLFNVCYLLGDPSLEEPEVADVGWGLVATTPDGEPTSMAVDGLHESVLETDPTGREMRPR